MSEIINKDDDQILSAVIKAVSNIGIGINFPDMDNAFMDYVRENPELAHPEIIFKSGFLAAMKFTLSIQAYENKSPYDQTVC